MARRTALATPTLYWLAYGGWQANEAAQPVPSRAIDLEKELAQMRKERPQVYQAYMAALASSGLDRATLPGVACDCSGFVCWALGVARDGSPLPGGWINTDSIVAGLPRNAIAETDTHVFDAIPTSRLVMWKAFVQ